MRGPSSAPALPGGVAAPGAGCRPHAVSATSSSASETLRRSGIRRCGLTPQDLTRVHDAVRIEGALHGPHELELHRGGVALELADLEHPDAVLGAEAAAELAHQVVHRAPHSVRAGEETLEVGARELAHGDMKVYIADSATRS